METTMQDLETEDFTIVHAAETIGSDLLGALLDEIKILQQPWQMMPQHRQNEVIDRLRERVKDNVQRAVEIISADTRVTVTATLQEVKFKGGIEAKLVLSKANQHRLDLADNVGEQVLVVIMPSEQFTEGMDDIKGDADQPSLLGDGNDIEADSDPLYSMAVNFVTSTGKATISAVQRHCRTGYNRTARFIERMEADGIVSPMGVNGDRQVLIVEPT